MGPSIWKANDTTRGLRLGGLAVGGGLETSGNDSQWHLCALQTQKQGTCRRRPAKMQRGWPWTGREDLGVAPTWTETVMKGNQFIHYLESQISNWQTIRILVWLLETN